MKEAYDLDWPNDPHPLDIEFAFIKAGGYIVQDGVSYGKGKFYHYRQAMTLLWPEDDHHRWSDLVLRRKCEEDILVLMGSGDSNKTYSSARYILANYWADPERTLWLVSSTEMRGAELRIWGKIKELFNRARSVHPWLAGSVIDSRTRQAYLCHLWHRSHLSPASSLVPHHAQNCLDVRRNTPLLRGLVPDGATPICSFIQPRSLPRSTSTAIS